jgi:hypothetical protein
MNQNLGALRIKTEQESKKTKNYKLGKKKAISPQKKFLFSKSNSEISVFNNVPTDNKGKNITKDNDFRVSHFSIKNRSLQKKRSKNLSISNVPKKEKRRSENISKYRKTSILKKMKANGFSEKFGSIYNNDPVLTLEDKRDSQLMRMNCITEVKPKKRDLFSPLKLLKEKNSFGNSTFCERVNTFDNNNLNKSRKSTFKKIYKENYLYEKEDHLKKPNKAKQDQMKMKNYCRYVFREAFNEINSIFTLFKDLYEIGSGSYAIAYSCKEKSTGLNLVLKTFKLESFTKKSYVDRFMVIHLFFL